MTAVCHGCGQTWPRHPVLEVACPDCAARVGAWCKRPSGHKAAELHTSREIAALACGVLAKCPNGPSARQPGLFPPG